MTDIREDARRVFEYVANHYGYGSGEAGLAERVADLLDMEPNAIVALERIYSHANGTIGTPLDRLRQVRIECKLILGSNDGPDTKSANDAAGDR